MTNLLAGIAGSRWGLRATLLVGLCLQLGGIGMLYGWNSGWSKAEGIVYVTFAQMLAGIAKDLTKLGGKTVAKLVTPDEKQSFLFKLVSFITGALAAAAAASARRVRSGVRMHARLRRCNWFGMWPAWLASQAAQATCMCIRARTCKRHCKRQAAQRTRGTSHHSTCGRRERARGLCRQQPPGGDGLSCARDSQASRTPLRAPATSSARPPSRCPTSSRSPS